MSKYKKVEILNSNVVIHGSIYGDKILLCLAVRRMDYNVILSKEDALKLGTWLVEETKELAK